MSSLSVTFVFLLFSCLCDLVSADVQVGGYIGGIAGVIILILDVIAIVDVLRSPRPILGKLLWILLIIFFPIGGMVIWLLCGRKTTSVL